MNVKRLVTSFLSGAVLSAFAAMPAMAQESDPSKEQFIPLLSYKTGPFGASGSGVIGGLEDYLTLLNNRDGGINGMKIVFEECDFGYNTERGVECYERVKGKGLKGAPVIFPMSTAVTYALLERSVTDKIPLLFAGYGRTDATEGRVFPWGFPAITNYWNQSTTKLVYIANQEGGFDKLKGMKIVNLHLKHPYGIETIPVWDKMAEVYGFEVTHLPVPWPGIDQKSLWLQIRKLQPDYVINRNWGISCTVPLREAARIGFPRDHIIGVWWCGAEEDTIPAGDAATGYITAAFHGTGTDYPVVQDIFEHVYGVMQGNIASSRVGSVYYLRGVAAAIVVTEAIRKAQEKQIAQGQGVGPVSGEEFRWAMENLDLTPERIAELGATEVVPPFKITCQDHEGSGAAFFQQWDGSKWVKISDWIQPLDEITRPMIEASAAQYAEQKGITPRSGMSMGSDCG
ncbi:MAG: ABC transporter substrate-binding protein [Arenicellales bacterium]|nr:ABC transporter substrate-binding protein [Arenicellales bacterium]